MTWPRTDSFVGELVGEATNANPIVILSWTAALQK